MLSSEIDSIEDSKKEIAIAAIEDVIKFHAVGGIDVSAREYIAGIESALLGL
jgi:hypothetical protein